MNFAIHGGPELVEQELKLWLLKGPSSKSQGEHLYAVLPLPMPSLAELEVMDFDQPIWVEPEAKRGQKRQLSR